MALLVLDIKKKKMKDIQAIGKTLIILKDFG